MFSIIKFRQFFSLYIIKYISIITSKKKLIVIEIICFKLTTLFKVTKIFTSKIEIKIDWVISLVFQINLVFNFNYLILAVTSICKISIFFLAIL